MASFIKKIKERRTTMNVFLFQEAYFLNEINNDSSLDLKKEIDEKYLVFDNSKDIYELLEEYKILNKIYSELVILSKNNENIDIKIKLDNIKKLNEYFLVFKLYYNSLVIGYNYWRNLLFTKFIKKLFKIKEYKTI